MSELELKEFLDMNGQSTHSLAMKLSISPQTMHKWRHRGNCMVQFDEDKNVQKIRLLTDKLVYEAS